MQELTGKRFGRWTVLKFSHRNKAWVTFWDCVCECGINRVVNGNNLRYGVTKSCGCYQREIAPILCLTHGKSKQTEHRIWASMLTRCRNSKSWAFKRYGGRGIKDCRKWKRFSGFYDDMGERPKGMFLDRINNNGNYCKKNCRWVNAKTQANNKSNSVRIRFLGITESPTWWAENLGLNYSTICHRAKKGLPAIQVLFGSFK